MTTQERLAGWEGEVVVTQADRVALEQIDDALGFLMDDERVIVVQAFARHRLATIEECAKAIAGLPTGRTEDIMEGQEQAYRVVEALAAGGTPPPPPAVVGE